MNKAKIILGYIVGFLASVFIACFVMTIIINSTVLNKSYAQKIIKNNNYYSELKKEMIEDMKAYMMSSGLSEEILNDIVTDEEIKKDVNSFLSSVYSGKKVTLMSSTVKKRIQKNIDSYLAEYNLKITDQKMLDEFVDDVVQIYDDGIKIYGISNQIGSKLHKVSSIFKKITIITGILSIIAVIVLIRLNFEYIYSVIISSGLIMLFTSFVIVDKVDINNVYIMSSMFSKFLIKLINSFILFNNIAGIILLILGIVFTVLTVIFKKNSKKTKKVLKKKR